MVVEELHTEMMQQGMVLFKEEFKGRLVPGPEPSPQHFVRRIRGFIIVEIFALCGQCCEIYLSLPFEPSEIYYNN